MAYLSPECIAFWLDTSAIKFVCSSAIKMGDAIGLIAQLKIQVKQFTHESTILLEVKQLHNQAKFCKQHSNTDHAKNIIYKSEVMYIIPDKISIFFDKYKA